MGKIVKFMHITTLGEIPRLSEEDRKQLDELFPTLPELHRFVLSNRHLAEVGVRGVLAMQTSYPSAAEEYEQAA